VIALVSGPLSLEGAVADPLEIKQGTTRIVTIKGLRDADGDLLDPTSWSIHAVARPGLWAAEAVVWRDNPAEGELQARVVDADPTLDPSVQAGEKWIDLDIAPDDSAGWTWSVAILDVEITEPVTNRRETFSTQLKLIPAVVRTA
jgi:hypothetical protein